MEDFRIYDRFSYKYRLLYCLMLNYYRNFYADNKFKGKVLVIGTCRKEWIKNYDKLYCTIQKYRKEDILTLKKFICFYDKQLKLLFDKLEDKIQWVCEHFEVTEKSVEGDKEWLKRMENK